MSDDSIRMDEAITRLRHVTSDYHEAADWIARAAQLVACGATRRRIDIISRVSATGRLTLEDLLMLREDGIDIHGLMEAFAGARRDELWVHPPAQAAQDRPRRDETPADGGADGQATPEPAERHTRDRAHQAAHHAQTQGGQAGIATGLAAIALAILAGQEQDR